MFDTETIREALKQGAGFFVALIMFAVWLKHSRDYETRLVGIIKDRKGDRDTLLELMGRINAHLERADDFKEFAYQAIEGAERPTPKRRLLDAQLAAALAKAKEAEGA